MPDDVDALLTDLLLGADPSAGFDAADLPPIAVSPLQGKLLGLLVRATGARRVLELGTLAGESTAWLAEAVGEGGEVVTIELDPHHAEVAGANLTRAGLVGRVTQHVGPALDVLRGVEGPFDFAFLDADKATMADQLRFVLPLVRSGGVVVCDNVIRGGRVADPADPSAAGVRAALELLAATPGVDATAIQTVGEKGHDGFAIAVVR